MKVLRKKQVEDLENALNHLFSAGWDLTHVQGERLVEDALVELQVAMELICNLVDPMR